MLTDVKVDHYLVLNTCPDGETARRLAEALVEEKLAACVNILPGLSSVYRWKGAVEHEAEHLLLIKTTAGRYPELEQAIRARHPYEVPEIIALPLSAGSAPYLDWVSDSCAPAVP